MFKIKYLIQSIRRELLSNGPFTANGIVLSVTIDKWREDRNKILHMNMLDYNLGSILLHVLPISIIIDVTVNLVGFMLHICLVFCVVFLFVFILCLVCPILPVSLDCPFLIALSVFSNVYLKEMTNQIFTEACNL